MHHNKVTDFSRYSLRLCCQSRWKSGTKSPRYHCVTCFVKCIRNGNGNLAKIIFLLSLLAVERFVWIKKNGNCTIYTFHVYDDEDDDSKKSFAFVYFDAMFILNVKWNIYDTLHSILIMSNTPLHPLFRQNSDEYGWCMQRTIFIYSIGTPSPRFRFK